jgi:hypothetical protein
MPSSDDLFSELCQWLWSFLLRQELERFMVLRNGAHMRKDKNKPGPSNMSRNTAFSLPEKWGGRNCLLPVDVEVVRGMKEALGGDSLLDFVSQPFAERAQEAYDSLNISKLKFDNVWDVFTDMLRLVFPA